MKPTLSRQEIWDRELRYAQDPRFWRSFAVETKSCAEFLLAKFEKSIWSDEPDEDLRVFFGPTFVRMLLGYSLENLIKGLLLSGPGKKNYIKGTKISFGNNGHDLIWLLGELGYQIDENDSFFLRAWSISAEWYGKYPFPLRMNQVLDEYRPMKSSEALFRRRIQGKRKFTLNDLLNGDIGWKELEAFKKLYSEIDALYPKAESSE